MPSKPVLSDGDKKAIRERLRTLCEECWIAQGYKKTSIKSLCDQAGISIGTFYTLYPAKEDLFSETISLIQTRLTEKILAISFRATIMYNSSTKGSEGMTQFEQLDTILEGQHGMLQTSEVVKRGIPKSVFYNYVKEKELEQAAHGVYVSPDAWVDGMYLLHLRCSQGIFSHETALFFHDLTDREPSPYSITVRRGYSTTRLKADGILVYTIKPELHDVGKSTARTPFGHTVPAYDIERTICDLLRCRSSIEMQTFQGALKMYARRKEKNLRRLMQYAGLFRVEKILRQYLEVLL